MSEQEMTFEDWAKELNRLARLVDGIDFEYTEATGLECWREMYDDGMTPEDAWAEEMDAARSMGM